MLFEKISQFKKARILLESNFPIEKSFEHLRKDSDFALFSDSELRLAIEVVYEGFGEKILNAASKIIGGDVSIIDSVLNQMKDQELKFNREENEIYVEFSNLIGKKEELKKNKDNPNYKEMINAIDQSMQSLNNKMNQLTKSHEKIFNAFEEKIKSITGKSNRKKKYFNAKRASDVKETENDRYEKIKALTRKSEEKIRTLEKFFGLDIEELERDVKEAGKMEKEKINDINTDSLGMLLSQDPEKKLYDLFVSVKHSDERDYQKRDRIKNIMKDIQKIVDSEDFKSYEKVRKKAILDFLLEMEKEGESLNQKIASS